MENGEWRMNLARKHKQSILYIFHYPFSIEPNNSPFTTSRQSPSFINSLPKFFIKIYVNYCFLTPFVIKYCLLNCVGR